MINKKWKLIKPHGSNGYKYIIGKDYKCACKVDDKTCVCESGVEHITVYTESGKRAARHIVKLHNNYIDNLKKE